VGATAALRVEYDNATADASARRGEGRLRAMWIAQLVLLVLCFGPVRLPLLADPLSVPMELVVAASAEFREQALRGAVTATRDAAAR